MGFTLTDWCNCSNVTHFCHTPEQMSASSSRPLHFLSDEPSSAFGDSGAGKLRRSQLVAPALLTC